MEIWKDIAGYEGHYQVSNFGNVRSIKREPIILKGDYQKNGYKRVYLWKDGRKQNMLVHRLVALSFLPNPDGYSDVNHIDENKSNNHVDNLYWCTHLHNMNYGSVKEKISTAKTGRTLSEKQKKQIRIDKSKRKWINDGQTEKFVFFYEVDSYLNNGWKQGRKERC